MPPTKKIKNHEGFNQYIKVLTSKIMPEGSVYLTSEPLSIFCVDSSGSCTGWAELQIVPDIQLVRFGKIRVIPEGKTFGDSYEYYCWKITKELEEAYKRGEHKYFCGVIEEPPFFRGSEVARMLVGLYQHIRIIFFNSYMIPFNPVNAVHAKKVFTGHGQASKQEVVAAVNSRFGTKLVFVEKGKPGDAESDEDIADAIQVGCSFIYDLVNE